MPSLTIVKIGGNIIDEEANLFAFLHNFAAIPGYKILVHGGGKMATRIAEALHIPQQMQDGRRITDEATLKVVTMVYAGYVNKNIVAQLQSFGCNALGLSGADANVIKSHKRVSTQMGVDYGFVGDVDHINSAWIQAMLQQGACLVVAPITHDGKGLLLNTNADTIAQEIAKSMCALYKVQLIYCFEKRGVLSNAADNDSVISTIQKSSYEQLKKDKIVSDGMLPKLDNAFAALAAGVNVVSIGAADDLPLLLQQKAGTSIIHE
jgi:acetylglutamate kinase